MKSRKYSKSVKNVVGYVDDIILIFSKINFNTHKFAFIQTEYLIQWKGYSADENSWTSENNLSCPAKLAKFEEMLQKKPLVF